MRMKRGQTVNRWYEKFPFHDCLHIMAASVSRTMIVRARLRLYRPIITIILHRSRRRRCNRGVWIPMRAFNRNAFAATRNSRWFIVFLFSRLSICKYNSFLSRCNETKTKPNSPCAHLDESDTEKRVLWDWHESRSRTCSSERNVHAQTANATNS